MLRALLIISALFNGAACPQNGSVQAKTPPPRLGLVKDKSLLGECGCSIYGTASDLGRDRYVLMSNLDGDAIVNLDGKDTRLRLVGQKDKQGDLKIGDHTSQPYSGGEVRLRADFFVTRVCPPTDESCEVTWYRVKVKVYRRGRRTLAWARGMCGC